MLKVQRRHAPPCKRSMWDQNYNRCTCSVVIRGTLNGKQISVATTKYLPPDKARNLEAARELAVFWERTGAVAHLPEFAPILEPEPTPDPSGITLEKASKDFLAEGKARNLAPSTMGKRKTVFEKQLLGFARDKGLRFVHELDLQTLREWRDSWKTKALSRDKRQKNVIGFLWFCEREGWFPSNYAFQITRGLGKIEVKKTATGYFMPDEYRKLLDATYLYSDQPGHGATRTTEGGDRIRAVMELMRWTGLRIGDAVTLEKRCLTNDPATNIASVIVRQKKTGEPVYCPIPPQVEKLLLSVPASQKGNTNDTWFFWTGRGKVKTLTSNWERSFMRLFRLAGFCCGKDTGPGKRAFPHMFRDTFAVETLLGGASLFQVSELLGHTSVKTTQDSYMPWVRARQTALNDQVIAGWAKQGIALVPPARPKKERRIA